MGEPDDFVNVSRVLDSGENGFEGDALCENLGFGDDEIMVEIVGSDVFVDGVGGNEMSRNGGGLREMGNCGVIGDLGFKGNVGGGGDFVDVVKEDVGVEDYGVIDDVMFLENGDGVRVRGSGDMGCEIMTPSAQECGMRNEALSCDSEVSGGNCMVATGLSSGETEVIGEKMNCCFDEDTVEGILENSDGLASQTGFLNDVVLNASTDSGFRSRLDIAKTEEIWEQGSVEVKERGLNGKDQVVHNMDLDVESPCLETVRSTSVERAYVETDTSTTCVNTESGDHQTEAVAGVNEMLKNKEETLQTIPQIIQTDACNGNLQCSVVEGHLKNNLLAESSGDHVNVSVDFMSSQKSAKLVADSQVLDDDDKVSNKGTETSKGVDYSEGNGDYGEGTRNFPDLVSTIEHTQVVAGYNEVIYNKILTVHDINMTTNDSFFPNPMSEIKAIQCEPKYADAIKHCEQIPISEIEVLEMNFEEATKYKGSEADALGVGLSVCGGDKSSVEATVKRTKVLDLKEDSTSGVDCISGCSKEVRNIMCDPVAEKSNSPTTEVSSLRQGLVSETGRVQHMKAVESFGYKVAHEQHDMVIQSEGIVEASVETISDDKIDSNSKPRFLDGDKNLVKDTNLSGLDSRGSGAVNDEKNNDMQKPDVKQRGSLNCEDDANKDHILGVKYDEGQVDVCNHQEMEIQDETINIGESEAIDDKIAEQVSPRSASSIGEFHSHYLLPPNNDGELSVGDLVWSKDKRFPWWPGQIYNPADASEKAMKHHKNDLFLVAYFGIRSFAWNDTSRIRPFKTHYSQINEQRNSEAYLQAVNCALKEVSRRVQFGLACSCIPKKSLVDIESQIVKNIGIHQEAGRRCHVDESTAASCFEPGELLEHIRLLALLPSADSEGRLQLTISKAQVAAFSRFREHHPLPKFHSCRGLLENDANTSRLGNEIQEHSEQVKGENRTSSKHKRDSADSLAPRKKDRSMSELISDMPQSDGEEEHDNDIRNSSVLSSAARKRRALESVTNGSSKRQIYYAAKVSTTSSHIPKKSFKIGECILRVASQLTGSPSFVKSNSENLLATDDGVEQHHGLDYFSQTSVNSQQGMMLLLKHSSIDEMLSQLHLIAQDPLKRYSFLNDITSFFSDFRQLVMGQKSRRWNQPIGRGSGKHKAPQSIINPPEDFEFDDMNNSYWTDRVVQNYDEEHILDRGQNGGAESQLVPHEANKEQIPDRGQNGEAEIQLVPNEADKGQMLDTAQYGEAKSQLVPSEADKSVKPSRKSRKRFSSGKQVMVAEKPVVEHMDVRWPDCTPTELILKFTEVKFVPSELNLNKIFRRFGPLRETETEVDRESCCAKVVYKRCSDAKVALSSAGIFNIFGPMLVSYELSYVPSAPFETLPAATVQYQEDAS